MTSKEEVRVNYHGVKLALTKILETRKDKSTDRKNVIVWKKKIIIFVISYLKEYMWTKTSIIINYRLSRHIFVRSTKNQINSKNNLELYSKSHKKKLKTF